VLYASTVRITPSSWGSQRTCASRVIMAAEHLHAVGSPARSSLSPHSAAPLAAVQPGDLFPRQREGPPAPPLGRLPLSATGPVASHAGGKPTGGTTGLAAATLLPSADAMMAAQTLWRQQSEGGLAAGSIATAALGSAAAIGSSVPLNDATTHVASMNFQGINVVIDTQNIPSPTVVTRHFLGTAITPVKDQQGSIRKSPLVYDVHLLGVLHLQLCLFGRVTGFELSQTRMQHRWNEPCRILARDTT
jgi:hypothetical protein